MGEESSYVDLIDNIFRPPVLTTLRGKSQTIRIQIHKSYEGEVEELVIDDIYPFHTIGDLCTRIYIEKGERDEYHPVNQCLLMPLLTMTGRYIHLQYLFNNIFLTMINPFMRMVAEPDAVFVDLLGNVKVGSIVSRNDMLLENTLFTSDKEEYLLHLFIYRDILSAYPGERPISRVDWEGKIKTYFPEYEKEYESGQVSEELQQFTPTRVERFRERGKIIAACNDLLESKPLRIIGESRRDDDINVSNIRNLRIAWHATGKRKMPFQLEALFYDMPVGELVPYIRYYPNANTPISKLFVEGPKDIPKLDDPTVLLTWASMASITPDEDLLMMKVLIKKAKGLNPPVYGTFYIFEDGSAKFIIQPSANIKTLSGDVDLVNLPETMQTFFSSFPLLQPFATDKDLFMNQYIPKNSSLEDAYLVLSIWLESKDTEPITEKRLKKVLPYFRAFFQETSSPIKEQQPILFLRYKCVNDFRTPSRESQFLQRIIDLQKVSGKTSIPNMEKFFKDEFNVTDRVAKERVAIFLADMTKFTVVNPEIREITQTENPGIDIAIFGKHPFYTFHIYRVDSVETLQRIKTLLSLFITVSPSDFIDYEESAEVLNQEEILSKAEAEAEADATGLQADAEGEEEGPYNPSQRIGGGGTNVHASASASASASAEIPFELDALGELPEFDEEPAHESLHDLVVKDSIQNKDLPLPLPLPLPQQKKGPVAGAAAGAGADATGLEDADADADAEEEKGEVSAKTYFSRRLRKYDSALFKYSKVHKSTKSYPQQCQANALKQPTVLSEGEFKRMKDIYKQNVAKGELQWVEYPIKEDAPLPAAVIGKGKGIVTERVTVLRYGTNLDSGKANIYTCSEFWCLADEFVILKKDFEGTRARDIITGNYKEEDSKQKDTCPFCKRGPVKKRDKINPGESIIQRTTPKSHTFVGFLGKGNPTHPKGFHLPCCFLKDKVIYTKDAQFKGESDEPASQVIEQGPMTYAYDAKTSKLFNLKNAYITGPEKLPLEFTPGHGPQIGILPGIADKYFLQTSSPDLVKQDHTFWKIMTDNTTREPSVSGFFRIAVENREIYEADSFFAAVAPFFGFIGADALKERIYEIVTPRIFMALNYGNFLFEFYDPAFEINEAAPLSKNVALQSKFAKSLGITTASYGVGNFKESILRGLRGYLAFKGQRALEEYSAMDSTPQQDIIEGKLFDRSILKESRQFLSLFTLPNMMMWTQGVHTYSNGVLFIILEIDKNGALQVKCPPYGISATMAAKCDIGFLLHFKDEGIWEPVFYTHNNIAKNEHYTTMIFTRKTYPDWPEVVKRRVDEYITQCKTSGLGIYTDSPNVASSTLIPLSEAIALDGVEDRAIYAILRDAYNHVSNVLFRQKDKEVDTFIFLPVIDDGSVYDKYSVELSWRHFLRKNQIAKSTIVEAFYKGLDPLFEKLPPTVKPTYEIAQLFRLDKTAPANYQDLYAFHLRGGLFVPVLKPDTLPPNVGSEEGQELQWMVDSDIIYTSDTKKVETFMDSKDFEEIYQHLRFTFANWLSIAEGNVLQDINAIIYDADGNINLNMSLSEKRMHLFIKIGRTILSWLDSSIVQVGKKPTLKRMDCRILRDAESCNNRCVWKSETSACLIHIPKEYTVGRTSVPANAYMVKRLIEELVRFPIKRRELLKKRVRQYVTLRAPFRSGDSYIIPEYLPQWTELLRMDWMKKKIEIPRHIEEFAWSKEEATALDIEDMPEELRVFMGPKYKSFYFISQFEGSVKTGYMELGVPGDMFNDEDIVTLDVLQKIATMLKLSMFQMEYEYDTPVPKEIRSVRIFRTRREQDCIVSVKLPDGTIGFLSTEPDKITAIPAKELPQSITKAMAKKGPVMLPT